jgi:hypothetical protein
MSNQLTFAVQQTRIDDYHRHAAESRRARTASPRHSRVRTVRTVFSGMSPLRGTGSGPSPAGALKRI